MDQQPPVFSIGQEDLLSMFLNNDNSSKLGGNSYYEDDIIKEEPRFGYP